MMPWRPQQFPFSFKRKINRDIFVFRHIDFHPLKIYLDSSCTYDTRNGGGQNAQRFGRPALAQQVRTSRAGYAALTTAAFTINSPNTRDLAHSASGRARYFLTNWPTILKFITEG